jgi:hypothetical protein
MSKMLDHTRFLFEYENKRRIEIIKSTIELVPILALLIAGAFYLMTEQTIPQGNGALLVLLIGTAVVYSSTACLWYLIRSFNDFWKGYSYRFLQDAATQQREIESIENYVRGYYQGFQFIDEEIERETENYTKMYTDAYLERLFTACASTNWNVNVERSSRLYKCRQNLVLLTISVVLLAFTIFLPNVIDRILAATFS